MDQFPGKKNKGLLAALALTGAFALASGQPAQAAEGMGPSSDSTLVENSAGKSAAKIESRIRYLFREAPPSMRGDPADPAVTERAVAKLMQEYSSDPSFEKKLGLLERYSFIMKIGSEKSPRLQDILDSEKPVGIGHYASKRYALTPDFKDNVHIMSIHPQDLNSKLSIIDVALKNLMLLEESRSFEPSYSHEIEEKNDRKYRRERAREMEYLLYGKNDIPAVEDKTPKVNQSPSAMPSKSGMAGESPLSSRYNTAAGEFQIPIPPDLLLRTTDRFSRRTADGQAEFTTRYGTTYNLSVEQLDGVREVVDAVIRSADSAKGGKYVVGSYHAFKEQLDLGQKALDSVQIPDSAIQRQLQPGLTQ